MLPLLLGASGNVMGQVDTARFELTPYAGYRFGGTFTDEDGSTSVELDDGEGFGLIFNLRESANTQWEVVYSRQDTDADTSALNGFAPTTEVRLHHLEGGGTYEFEGGAARPYLALTLGGTRIEPRIPGLKGDTFWSMSIGTGLLIRPTARVGIRLEARAWATLVDSNTSLFCVSAAAGAACAIQIDGRVLWQLETSAGIVFRF